MGEPIRVLHVVTYMGRGGLETMIMNYYRNIDRSKVQFDFLTHRDERWDYDDEIEELGGKIYHLPRLNPFSPKYLKALDNFFKKHKEYNIVHCHQDCLSGIVLKSAKKNGVNFTIAHSHSSNQNKNLKYVIKLIAKKFIPKYADYMFACGKEAGEWMFNTSDFIILNNAIDTKRYIYNEEKSLKMKEKLDITGKFVIGHVGRFRQEKNHSFIIDIFKEVCEKESNSALLLVGDGPLEEDIKRKVDDLGLLDKVKFLGARNDVNDLMQCMDIFILPSLYEGIPLTMIESQVSGLDCIISDKVPKECIVTKNVKSISLEETSKYWANEIIKNKDKIRKNLYNEIQNSKFDIKSNAIWLQEFYLRIWQRGIKLGNTYSVYTNIQ